MVKMTLIENGRTMEMEGKAVIAFVYKPALKNNIEDKTPDMASLMMGFGNPAEILSRTGSSLGSLFSRLIKNPLDQLIVSIDIIKSFKNAIAGEGVEVKVEEERIVPVKKEETL